jgi:hypothetical protein
MAKVACDWLYRQRSCLKSSVNNRFGSRTVKRIGHGVRPGVVPAVFIVKNRKVQRADKPLVVGSCKVQELTLKRPRTDVL